MKNKFLNKIVDRFLGWKLPEHFGPDCGISFVPPEHPNSWPIGTNLLTADQAQEMFEHCLSDDHVILPKELSKENIQEQFAFETEMICSDCFNHEPNPKCEFCHGEIYYKVPVVIPWNVLKQIYEKIVKQS